jgi:hypothetical protein
MKREKRNEKAHGACGRGHGAQGRVPGAQGMVGALLFSWRSLREIFSENQFFVPQRSAKEAQKTQNLVGFARNHITKFT